MNYSTILIFFRRNLEAFIWIAAIAALAFTSPVEACYSLCPLHNLGIHWCPGCGLGHAISWLFRGEVMHSMEAHPLGIPALLILILRIVTVFRRNYQFHYHTINNSIPNG